MKTFSDFGIDAPASYNSAGDGYATCPKCSGSRRKSKVKCLSVNQTLQCWQCFHCGYTGSLKSGEERPSIRPKIIRKPNYTPSQLFSDDAIRFFMQRGIPLPLIMDEQITVADAYMPQEEDFVPCIQFPYRKNGSVANVKYRALGSKSFRQVADAEKIFFRQDHIAKDLTIITEGEFDALACVVAGFNSAISVPDGAPSPKAKDYTSKFGYLDQEPDPFADVEKIILAVDDDEPGRVLREELARRLGRDRCYTVRWPAGCKDANDVLLNEGEDVLRRCIDRAEQWPIEDAVYISDLAQDMIGLMNTGLPRGLSTGWPSLDGIFTIAPGQLTVITGIPSHGKSQFVDALAVNMMQLHGWRFLICSPENYPTALHGITLMEKWTRRTVRTAAPAEAATLISNVEAMQAMEEMNQAITFLAPDDAMTIPDLLNRATSFVRRRGIQGLIIDPWNEFDHTRERHLTETEYISTMLGAIRRWARKYSVHVFVVAHPTKILAREDGSFPVPGPYDINGGAAWRNKSENCLAVWRKIEPNNRAVEIHCHKVRWRNLGRMGESVVLEFNEWTGTYVEGAV